MNPFALMTYFWIKVQKGLDNRLYLHSEYASHLDLDLTLLLSDTDLFFSTYSMVFFNDC